MEAIVYLVVGAAIYFLPAFVASQRNHRNAGAIFILNLFLGWTFLGWVIALIWSLTYQAPTTPAEVAREQEARKLSDAQVG